MMKSTSISIYSKVLFLLLLTGIGLQGCKSQPWESLFNGKDLEGWSVKCIPADKGKVYWAVNEGIIECNSLGDSDHNYVWLATDREFTDFHLKLQFQLFKESAGNSGVQFRSSYDDSDTASFGGWLSGPQADIHGPLAFRTGLIYDETENVRRWIHPSLPDWNITPGQAPESALLTRLVFFEDDPEGWNSMEIVCRGMRVETRVNGNLVTDFDATGILDDELHKLRGSGNSGCIAFQLHSNDELMIRFRNLLIREL